MTFNLNKHPNQPPGPETDAPIPGAGDKGLEAWQNRDDISVSFWDYKIKPLSPKSKPNEPMKHAGQVIPIVLLNLIIAALASESTSPDVKRYLLGVLS